MVRTGKLSETTKEKGVDVHEKEGVKKKKKNRGNKMLLLDGIEKLNSNDKKRLEADRVRHARQREAMSELEKQIRREKDLAAHRAAKAAKILISP